MPRLIESREDSTDLAIPQLVVGPIRIGVGYVVHVLEPGSSQYIVDVSELQVSPRVKEKVYELGNGEKIIVTSRRKLERPAGVDGILRQVPDGYAWISHKRSDEVSADIRVRGLEAVARDIAANWRGKFSFQAEERDGSGSVMLPGLRPPQIGALHAIGAHWSLYKSPATVVMPTGTGKTEAMLATLVNYVRGTLLVVVPSQVLRDQTRRKFETLGLLRSLGNLATDTRNPIVGVITQRPRTEADLRLLEECNVIVTTMSAIAEGAAVSLGLDIARRVDTLIVDEAHHIGAAGWTAFREQFRNQPVLQFTATPFRRDGKLVDGEVIYNYPLRLAQQDGYFRKITFEPVYGIDQEAGDEAVAALAVIKLRADIAKGFNHLLMARCRSIDRAADVLAIYNRIAPEFLPLLVHSELGDTSNDIERLRSGTSRIVVCVNMLGEGFDLPELKIAAVHDTHRSLSVLLQFTGRFTRSSGSKIGEATVVANIADGDFSSALERLYSEDADWNQLLSELSSEAAKAHSDLVRFLNDSKRLDDSGDQESVEISHQLLRPTMSTLTYEASQFEPKMFFEGLPKEANVHRVWLHEQSHTLYFVTRLEPHIQWTRSRELRDRQWDLFVLHYDESRHLLFLASSDRSSVHEKIATAVGATRLISGDVIFRSLGHINRLIFQNVGVRKHGRRNLRYALYTGADVAQALSVSEQAGSVKSNLSGTGWEGGRPVTIGCSYKGRVWSREVGTVPEFVKWAEAVGAKLLDASIDTSQIIANVLIPEEIDRLPDKMVLSVEWPLELLRQSEERVSLQRNGEELPISMFEIEHIRTDLETSEMEFRIFDADERSWVTLMLKVGGTDGYRFTRSSEPTVLLKVGSVATSIEEWFNNYPPMVRYVDLSEMDGNLLIRSQGVEELRLPAETFDVWDWSGVDVMKESIWKAGNERRDSIQWRAAQHFIDTGFDVVFDDDSAGESADLVCLKEESDFIRLVLIHCKYTRDAGGVRIKDVVEVASQAIRSAKWKWKFRDLCRHLLSREKRTVQGARTTRFLAGDIAALNRFARSSRFKEIRPEIVVVQPGLSRERCTTEQTSVLAAAYNYLKETIGVDLDVICSA